MRKKWKTNVVIVQLISANKFMFGLLRRKCCVPRSGRRGISLRFALIHKRLCAKSAVVGKMRGVPLLLRVVQVRQVTSARERGEARGACKCAAIRVTALPGTLHYNIPERAVMHWEREAQARARGVTLLDFSRQHTVRALSLKVPVRAERERELATGKILLTPINNLQPHHSATSLVVRLIGDLGAFVPLFARCWWRKKVTLCICARRGRENLQLN